MEWATEKRLCWTTAQPSTRWPYVRRERGDRSRVTATASKTSLHRPRWNLASPSNSKVKKSNRRRRPNKSHLPRRTRPADNKPIAGLDPAVKWFPIRQPKESNHFLKILFSLQTVPSQTPKVRGHSAILFISISGCKFQSRSIKKR